MFDELKGRADRCAASAGRLRRERDRHARRGWDVLRQRVGSPLGLALCFGTGVLLGRHRPPRPEPDERPGKRGSPGRGQAASLLHGPLGAAAIRLGSAFIASRLIAQSGEPGAGADPV